MSVSTPGTGLEVFSVVVDTDGSIAQMEDDDQYHTIAADFAVLFDDLDQQAEQRGVTKIPVVTGFGDGMAKPQPRPIMVSTTGALVSPDDPDDFMVAFQANEAYDGEYHDVSLAQVGKLVNDLNLAEQQAVAEGRTQPEERTQWVPGFILITPDRKLVDLAYALNQGWIK